MNLTLFMVLLVFGYILVLAYRHWSGRDWLPRELKGAKLIEVEQDQNTQSILDDGQGGKRQVVLAGRGDQAYLTPSGELVPIEFKNHHTHQVYETDIAQISLQGWQARQKGTKTAPFGFVVVRGRNNGQRKAMKVKLLDDRSCEQLINRYIDLVYERATPTPSKSAKCRSCGHQRRCPA